ncbi:hypothetical protein P691DRAFT_812596, partial [Macrolepiota fuliginosa MF-IS2]
IFIEPVKATLLDLPPEILTDILLYLPSTAAIICRGVNRCLQKRISESAKLQRYILLTTSGSMNSPRCNEGQRAGTPESQMLQLSGAATLQAETVEDGMSLYPDSLATTSVVDRPQKKALLIGIEYKGDLVGPHKDVKDMKRLLIERHGYAEENVTLLIDDEDHPSLLHPTREIILERVEVLTQDVQSGDTLFFHYAGHSTQVENRRGSEEDDMDECIYRLALALAAALTLSC